MSKGKKLLHVKNLRLSLRTDKGAMKIVDGVDLEIYERTTVGLIGETGAGKTVTARAIMGILQPVGETAMWYIEGEVWYKGKDLLKLPKEEARKMRGSETSMIFQNPIPSLHPIEMVGWQTGEPVETHRNVVLGEVRKLVEEYFGKVEISDAKKRFDNFRDQFSGGEAQRILIAMALINNPDLLIADEPTSSLDVTVQRQVLELLKQMKKRFGLSMLFITHNLAVIAEMSDYVYVMYAGKIMEHADVFTIFKKAKHPYTRGLLSAIPRIDSDTFEFGGILGEPATPPYNISGCIFHPRCPYQKEVCRREVPEMIEFKTGHFVACHRVSELDKG